MEINLYATKAVVVNSPGSPGNKGVPCTKAVVITLFSPRSPINKASTEASLGLVVVIFLHLFNILGTI